jgi:hypothetical protein
VVIISHGARPGTRRCASTILTDPRVTIEAAGFWASAARRGTPPAAEEVAIMGPIFRPCQDCGGEQLFEQMHETPGSCPDAPDGQCPEWLCTGCGAAELSTGLPGNTARAVLPDMAGRVA